MRALYNVFNEHYKKFVEDTGESPYIRISFRDGESYQININAGFGEEVADICICDDFCEVVKKLFKQLTKEVKDRQRRNSYFTREPIEVRGIRDTGDIVHIRPRYTEVEYINSFAGSPQWGC